MSMQYFIHVEVNFKKKILVLPFLFLVLARNMMMSQQLIIHFWLHYQSSGRSQKVKNEGNFQTFSSKSGRSCLEEVLAYKRFQIYDLVFLKTSR